MSEVAVPPLVSAARSAGELLALDRSLVHGLAWTGAAKWSVQALSWASTLVVARLLTPEDYGLVGMASLYLGLVTLVSEFGLGAAVLNLRDLSTEQVAQLNGLSLGLGLAGVIVSCVAAVPLGQFFRAPQLPMVVVAMSSTFLITGFKTVPLALLQRDLRFKALALVDTAQATVLAVSMIGFALLGLRYWTLVLGAVLGALLSTGVILMLRRHAMSWPRLESLRQAVTLSWHVIVSRISWYAYSNADFLVAGRILGKAALGFYDLGWTLANVPIEKVTALVGQVTPAFFSAVQKDHAAMRRYLLSITEGLALITFPVCLGLALVAKDFVMLLLGSKWERTIAPLQLLAAYAGLRSIIPLLPQVLVAIGDSRFSMRISIASALVMPVTFYIAGTRWGIVGLALSWVVVYPLVTYPLCRRVFQKIELPAREYLGALVPALTASALMALMVVALQQLVAERWAPGLRLGVEVMAGAAVFALTCFTLHRARIRAFWELVSAARRPRPRSCP